MNPLFTVSFKCLCRRCRNLCRCRRGRRLGRWHHHQKRFIQAITVALESRQSEHRRACSGRFNSGHRHRCRRVWRRIRRLSGGDYRRCDRRRASILDLSLLFWSEHVCFLLFFSLLHGFFRNYQRLLYFSYTRALY